MNKSSIYEYVKAEEGKFESDEIQLGENWHWNFRRHVQLLFHLKNGVFYTGANDWLRAFKNIMEPMLNLSYWAEDIEVKDVEFFIENEMGRVLAFLIRKYHHEVYVREHDLDTLFDEITESDLDYGGVLVQKGAERPEVIHLNSVAFCDQTDILGGPIAFKHHFSPDALRKMSKLGWGEESNGATTSIEELIELADTDKTPAGVLNTKSNKVPGKTIEVYIIRGNLPEAYLKDNDNLDDHYNQLQIIAFYSSKKGVKEGVTLYRKKESEGNLKFHTSKKVYGRALGRGAGEALIHPQIWTNFLTIHKTRLLEAASKVPLYTDDPGYTQRNKIQEMENLEVTVVEDGKKIVQVPTAAPANIQLLERSVNEWLEHGQLASSAFDPMLGKEPVSGTTFRGQERTVQQGRGLHERRRGQRAKFIEEIYRDWILPDIKKEVLKGKKFLATLTTEEMQWVADRLAENYATRKILDVLLSGEIPPDKEMLRQEFLRDFSKMGNRHLLEILKGEFDDVEIRMGINIASKQKDLVGMSDKIFSIFQTAFTNPQQFIATMQVPGMAKAFQDILEFSGVDSVDFTTLVSMPPPQMQLPQGQMNQMPTQQMAPPSV